MADSWLSLILGALGAVGGSIVAPGAGTAAGFSIGAGLGGLISGGDNSSDPGKSSDQEYMRMLARQIGQNPIAGASGQFENLAGSLASRGMLNSGTAGAAFGGLEGSLFAQRVQNQISAGNLLSGIGATPISQGTQAGQVIGNSLGLLTQGILDKNAKDAAAAKTPTVPVQNLSFNPYSNQDHSMNMLAFLGYGKRN